MKNKISFAIGIVILITLIIWLPVAAFILAILALCAGVVMIIWALVKRQSKKIGSSILAIGAVTFVASAIAVSENTPPSTENQATETENQVADQEMEQSAGWQALEQYTSESSGSSQEQTETPVQQAESTTDHVDPTDEAEFEAYAANLTGKSFIKTVKLKDEKATIKYVKSYKEYKKLHPNSLLKKSDYEDYFSTGDKIEKILVEESVRLLRQFPALKEVSIEIPYDGKTYSVDVQRDEVNEYLGFKVEDLSVDDGSWQNKFVAPIVYDKDEREKFVDRFGK